MSSSPSPSTRLDVLFAAPVPRGHEIVWMRIHHAEAQRTGELVVDTTDAVLYTDESLRSLFEHPAVGHDPLQVASRYGWQIVKQVAGRVSCATLATGTEPALRTCLFLDVVTASPYR